MGKEKIIENHIKAFLDRNNIYYHKNHGSVYSTLGIPDIECCYRGKYIGLEIKAKKNFRISLAQIKNGLRITKNGGIFAFVNDLEQIISIIEDIKNDAKIIRNVYTVEMLETLLEDRINKIKE